MGERRIKKVRDERKATQVGCNGGEECVGGPADERSGEERTALLKHLLIF